MSLLLDEIMGDKADLLRKAVLKEPQRDGWNPTEDEIGQYMEDDCHILAIALHRRLGWPIAAITDWGDMYSDENPGIAHVMLEVPGEANLCIDINGWTSSIHLRRDVFFDLCEPETVWGLSEADILAWSGDDADRPLWEVRDEDLSEADQIAERLIRSLGLADYEIRNRLQVGRPMI